MALTLELEKWRRTTFTPVENALVLPTSVYQTKRVRLVSMHTSANDGPGLYENQTAYSLQRGPRSLTRETEEEEYDDGISEIAYERFLM